jgi:Sec-independent protein translocase protein TatA
MPAVAYQIGRAVRQMQRYARAVRDEFSEELDYVEEQYKTLKGEVEETQRSLREQQAQMNAELRAVDSELARTVDVTPAPIEPVPMLTEPSTNGASAEVPAETPPSDAAAEPAPDAAPEPEPNPLIF